MSVLAEQFSKVDKQNHSRMKGAIEDALAADFKVEEEPKHRQENGFSKKPIEFFVREKIAPESLRRSEKSDSEPTRNEEVEASEAIDEAEISHQEPGHISQENSEIDETNPQGVAFSKSSDDLDELAEDLAGNDEVEPGSDDALPNIDALSQKEDTAQTEHYDDGFAAGRAAALSELEEQRIENLEVLRSISEKLLTDSCFDFDDISSKVLDTVNELSSQRCGIEIDKNPEGFLHRIEQQIDQVRNLSKDRWVFFNDLDLESLRTFDEFENFFSDAKVRSDPQLKRGDVIVKVGGVELRDAPFSDYEEGSLDE
jgi:flagellar biosynthesis/type III secretory pathway protein FliH